MGTLYLLPVWLGDQGDPDDMPARNAAIAAGIRLYFAEHERTARHMLRRLVPTIVLPDLEIHRLDKDSTDPEIASYVDMLRSGKDAAIVSESGMPAVADPGARLVKAAQVAGIRVVPLIGPSSLLLALAASGMNGQQFRFHGYLPREPHERRKAIQHWEQEVIRTGATQIFIETPYRNDALLEDMLRAARPDTLLCVASNITQTDESILTLPIAVWRQRAVRIGKVPAVFLLGA